ncbi:MAG: hypothetical protein JXB10_05495 [Pirellulales bacterium]|nr:hypothetical protein [Pirellulales bacterium]
MSEPDTRDILLNAKEEWLLRLLDKYCCQSQKEWFIFPRNAWIKKEENDDSLSEVVSRFDYQELENTITDLNQLNLATINRTSSGVFSSVTAFGKQYIRRLDNPDIVEKLKEWARRKPVIAYIIIGTILVGSICGLVSIIIEVVQKVIQVLNPAL